MQANLTITVRHKEDLDRVNQNNLVTGGTELSLLHPKLFECSTGLALCTPAGITFLLLRRRFVLTFVNRV